MIYFTVKMILFCLVLLIAWPNPSSAKTLEASITVEQQYLSPRELFKVKVAEIDPCLVDQDVFWNLMYSARKRRIQAWNQFEVYCGRRKTEIKQIEVVGIDTGFLLLKERYEKCSRWL